MKEILFISHKYPPIIGGMEKQAYELIEYISKEIKIHKIVFDGSESKLHFLWKLRSRVKKIMRQNPNIGLIHFNDGLISIIGSWVKKKYKVKVSTTAHGLDVVFPSGIYQNKISRTFNSFDKIFCVSQATAEACYKLNIPSSKIQVIKNGVDHNLKDIEFDKNIISKIETTHHINLENKNIVFSYGRPVRRKGFSWFIEEVLPKLSKDTIFLIAGPSLKSKSNFKKITSKIIPASFMNKINLALGMDSEELKIKTLIDSEGLKGKVFHIGKLPFKELMQLLSEVDVFIMPNKEMHGDFEGFGLVALESGIRQAVVVASGVEGITDAIVDGKNGILLPSCDAKAWTKKVSEITSDKIFQKEFGSNAQQYILENYSWNIMGKAYLDAFTNLMSDQVKQPLS